MTNLANATGSFKNKTVLSNTANATVTIVQHPALTITKTPNPTTYTDGQSVTYTYTVKNTGNVTL